MKVVLSFGFRVSCSGFGKLGTRNSKPGTTAPPNALFGGCESPRGPCVFQCQGAIEDELAGPAVLGVGHEISEALELEAVVGRGAGQRGLELGADDIERVRV